jgi:hypothetical protein
LRRLMPHPHLLSLNLLSACTVPATFPSSPLPGIPSVLWSRPLSVYTLCQVLGTPKVEKVRKSFVKRGDLEIFFSHLSEQTSFRLSNYEICF